ncbi:hypothetical protein [Actinomadura geliboluensis]|uniref:Uncharacterized protein n=1 Tax=Actinomadura geliboluensis TaxID=882440 RepID=A0A5S4H0V8_9ACTN|nr:hypothetical protein [Actinomadura geliboluensis]TMR32410.1 hypothetical protein ETD96_29705 [Actinomadura geliboluensis]
MSRVIGRAPGASRFRGWRHERGSWVLCEEVRAGVHELGALLAARRDHGEMSARDAQLLHGAEEALKRAENAVDAVAHSRFLSGAHITTAQLHLNSGRSLWMRTLSPLELQSYLPAMYATVKQHLPPTDENRVFVERIARETCDAQEADRSVPLTDAQLISLVAAVDAARQAALREKLRAESFVWIVQWITVFLCAVVILIGVLSALWTTAVPLCFTPSPSPGSQGEFGVVCPTNAAASVPAGDLTARTRDVAGWGDYIVVEFVGLVAAGIAAASALRKIRGTSTAFGIPVALAMLKLPTGAITAVLGLLLMRGAFIPGLSALDSSAQIIAWAVVLGYSQELFTKFVDRQGQAVLDSVRDPAHNTALPPAPTPRGPADRPPPPPPQQ